MARQNQDPDIAPGDQPTRQNPHPDYPGPRSAQTGNQPGNGTQNPYDTGWNTQMGQTAQTATANAEAAAAAETYGTYEYFIAHGFSQGSAIFAATQQGNPPSIAQISGLAEPKEGERFTRDGKEWVYKGGEWYRVTSNRAGSRVAKGEKGWYDPNNTEDVDPRIYDTDVNPTEARWLYYASRGEPQPGAGLWAKREYGDEVTWSYEKQAFVFADGTIAGGRGGGPGVGSFQGPGIGAYFAPTGKGAPWQTTVANGFASMYTDSLQNGDQGGVQAAMQGLKNHAEFLDIYNRVSPTVPAAPFEPFSAEDVNDR